MPSGEGGSAEPSEPILCQKEQWDTASDMPHQRGEHAGLVYQGKMYLFGGVGLNGTSHRKGPNEVDVYDPTKNEWSTVTTMPETRNHFTVGNSLYGNEVWITGGKLDGTASQGTQRVDVYNLDTNEWRRGPDLPEEHWAGPSVVLGDHLHVLTGAINNRETEDHHFVLDLKNEAGGWQIKDPVPEPRVHAAAVAFEQKVWLIGGEYHHKHDGDTDTVQVYDPETDDWDLSQPKIPEKRSHHEWATFVFNGEIWSVSGVDSANSPRAQATIYRFDGNQWNQWFDLPKKLASPAVSILDGTMIVTSGGVDDWFGGDLDTVYTRCVAE